MSDALLSVRSMTKRYGGYQLGPVDFDLNPGEVVALLGANGAGKSTLLRCLANFSVPDGGTVRYAGRRLDEHAANTPALGYVGRSQGLFELWDAATNLSVLGRALPAWNGDFANKWSARFGFRKDLPLGKMSDGDRDKLALVVGFARNPKVVILDEPTAHLDLVARDAFLELLADFIGQGDRAALLATHHLSEVARLVDRLAFLKEGKFEGPFVKDDLVQQEGKPIEEVALQRLLSTSKEPQ